MEEVIGSIPIRSTKESIICSDRLLRLVAFGSKLPTPCCKVLSGRALSLFGCSVGAPLAEMIIVAVHKLPEGTVPRGSIEFVLELHDAHSGSKLTHNIEEVIATVVEHLSSWRQPVSLRTAEPTDSGAVPEPAINPVNMSISLHRLSHTDRREFSRLAAFTDGVHAPAPLLSFARQSCDATRPFR